MDIFRAIRPRKKRGNRAIEREPVETKVRLTEPAEKLVGSSEFTGHPRYEILSAVKFDQPVTIGALAYSLNQPYREMEELVAKCEKEGLLYTRGEER